MDDNASSGRQGGYDRALHRELDSHRCPLAESGVDDDLAAMCQSVYIEHGGVQERGSHDELIELGGRYAALYNLQSAIRERRLEADERRHSQEGPIHVFAS